MGKRFIPLLLAIIFGTKSVPVYSINILPKKLKSIAKSGWNITERSFGLLSAGSMGLAATGAFLQVYEQKNIDDQIDIGYLTLASSLLILSITGYLTAFDLGKNNTVCDCAKASLGALFMLNGISSFLQYRKYGTTGSLYSLLIYPSALIGAGITAKHIYTIYKNNQKSSQEK